MKHFDSPRKLFIALSFSVYKTDLKDLFTEQEVKENGGKST